jgi:hypothetical protein
MKAFKLIGFCPRFQISKKASNGRAISLTNVIDIASLTFVAKSPPFVDIPKVGGYSRFVFWPKV